MQNQPKTEIADMIPKEFESETGPPWGTVVTHIDPAQERRVRRKIDCVVLPLVSHCALFMIL